MFYKISFILVWFTFITACAGNPAAIPSPTPTSAPTSTQPPPTATVIPPTEATESAPVLQLDKPMTTIFDPFNKDVMPEITGENQVTEGLLANTIDAKWRQDGIYDANGKVILPDGVMPVKPEEWEKKILDGGLDLGRIQLFWPSDRKNEINLAT